MDANRINNNTASECNGYTVSTPIRVNGWSTTEWEFKSIFGLLARHRSLLPCSRFFIGERRWDGFEFTKMTKSLVGAPNALTKNSILWYLSQRIGHQSNSAEPAAFIAPFRRANNNAMELEMCKQKWNERNWICCAHFLENANLRRFYDLLRLQAVTNSHKEWAKIYASQHGCIVANDSSMRIPDAFYVRFDCSRLAQLSASSCAAKRNANALC